MNQLLKLLIEAGPLVIFFVANNQFGIYAATGVFMVAMLVSIIAAKIMFKKVSLMQWMSLALVLLFGGATIYFEDELFIKLKPTILNTLFGLALLTGVMFGKPFLKNVMETAFPDMPHEAWIILSRRWGFYFLFSAALNEVIWRNFSTELWIASKLWLMMPLGFVFAMTQVPLMMKYLPQEDEESTKDKPET